jgi:glycosyltransferase involved in cell wall biosynthesis
VAEPLPRITIVTPSFNQGAFVEATVRSVFEQRYPDLEYILMDGGSKDDTLERLEPYRHRFAHFQSAPDGGQSAAIADGFDRSTGEIMAYLNSDDVLLPGSLAFVARFFREHPDVDAIYGHRAIIDEKNRVLGHWILPPHSSTLMRRWDLIPQESCFWRRSLWERAGNVDPTFRFAMDYDLFVRYMDAGRFRRVNRFLAAYRVHQQAKTHQLLETVGAQEIQRVYGKYRIRVVWGLSHVMGMAFPLWVRLRSAYFVRMHQSYPGLPPGWDYDLGEFWGGLLVE